MKIDSEIKEAIRLVVERYDKMVSFDVETFNSYIKYSSWMAFFSSAGIGFILIQSEKLIHDIPKMHVSLLLVCITFSISIICSGVMYFKVITFLSRLRNIQILFYKQEINLVSAEAIDLKEQVNAKANGKSSLVGSFVQKLNNGDFLEGDDRELFKEYLVKISPAPAYIKVLLSLQILVTLSAFFSLIPAIYFMLTQTQPAS